MILCQVGSIDILPSMINEIYRSGRGVGLAYRDHSSSSGSHNEIKGKVELFLYPHRPPLDSVSSAWTDFAEERGLVRAPGLRGQSEVLVSERVPGSDDFAKNAGSRAAVLTAQAKGPLLLDSFDSFG